MSELLLGLLSLAAPHDFVEGVNNLTESQQLKITTEIVKLERKPKELIKQTLDRAFISALEYLVPHTTDLLRFLFTMKPNLSLWSDDDDACINSLTTLAETHPSLEVVIEAIEVIAGLYFFQIDHGRILAVIAEFMKEDSTRFTSLSEEQLLRKRLFALLYLHRVDRAHSKVSEQDI